MIKPLYSLLFSAIGAVCCSAATVQPEAPGTLACCVGNPATETGLKISGPVDAADFYFMAREMPVLRELDLSEATIKAYKGKKLAGRTSFPAGMIPQGVFAASAIEKLTLPADGKVVIGDMAFAGTPLREVAAGANVSEIGDGAFASCPELITATIASPLVGAGAFADCPNLRKVTFTAPATTDTEAFARNTALTAIAGADLLTAIGDGTFTGCTGLTAFDFGTSLTTVGERAFSRTSLSKADLSHASGGLTVEPWAFAEIPTLTSADLSAAKSVGDGVVFLCPSLSQFVPSASADSIGAYAYAKATSLSAAGLLPEGVRVVGAHALHGLSQITAITIPATMEMIGTNAMADMTGLTEMTTLASDVPVLGKDVWRGVDQSAVTLNVPYGAANDYSAAAQWQNFKIKDPAGIDDAATGGTDSGDAIKARFAGPELQVSIPGGGSEIKRLALHDASGLLLIAVEPMADFVTVDTSAFTGHMFIVSALMTDGRNATIKLARN